MGYNMTKESLQVFTARISVASKSELVVIMYDVILTDIEEAKKAYELKDKQNFQKELKHAARFINELMGDLDYSYAISYSLMSLYIYISKIVINACYQVKVEELHHAVSLIHKLRSGFEGIREEDTAGPVMQNAQKVYAGFTYGKGTLNETYVDPNQYNRGFKA